MVIKSQFGSLFIVRILFQLFASFFMVFVIFYAAISWRGFHVDNILVWVGFFSAGLIIIGFFPWFIYPLKSLEVSDAGVTVTFILLRRRVLIPFGDIKRFKF